MIYGLLPLFKDKLLTDTPGMNVFIGGEIDPVTDFGPKVPLVWIRYAGYSVDKSAFNNATSQISIRVQVSVITRTADSLSADSLSESITESLLGFKAAARYSNAELIAGDSGQDTQAGFEHIPFLFSVKTTVKGNN